MPNNAKTNKILNFYFDKFNIKSKELNPFSSKTNEPEAVKGVSKQTRIQDLEFSIRQKNLQRMQQYKSNLANKNERIKKVFQDIGIQSLNQTKNHIRNFSKQDS